MKAILLAAGYGTRLMPITKNTPKCMVKVNGIPLISYWLELLKGQEIDHILINTHYLANIVEDYCMNSLFSKKIVLSYEEELLGTGGTIFANKDFFDDAPFLIAHADNLTNFDLRAFINAHRERPEGAEMTMMTFNTDDPQSCGILELNSSGVVIKMHEKIKKPRGCLANAAVYIVERSVLDFIVEIGKKKLDFSTEVIPKFINKIYTFHNTIYHRDIGTIESLNKANEEYLF